jgi:CDP-diacylglycerol--glycerol-3-phosphate 3-phosphatidyltransferase
VAALLLLLGDWLDGKLAIWLKQQTELGALLDSIADAALYAAILLGVGWLKFDLLAQELTWIFVGFASYALTTSFGLAKFHRLPSYHTRAAKICWFLATIALVLVLVANAAWPLRVALMGATLTNLEATVITAVLPEYRSNVPTLYHALRLRRAAGS